MIAKRLACGVAVACLVGSLGIAGPAHAEKYKAKDARGDVVQFDGDAEALAPDNVATDVLKSVVNHSAKRVTIKVKFADLQSGSAKAGIIALVKTNKLSYDISLVKISGISSGFEIINSRGKQIKCGGKAKVVKPPADIIKLSVPRTCLGSPRWVKVGIGALSAGNSSFFADDALRLGGLRQDGNITYGPKVRRG